MVDVRLLGAAVLAAALQGGTLHARADAGATPFKCVHPATARVTYRDSPCEDPREVRALTIVDNVVAAERVPPGSGRGTPDLVPAPGLMTLGTSKSSSGNGSSACRAARRDYDMAVSEIKKDLHLMDRRHREAVHACGEPFDKSLDHESLARLKHANKSGHLPKGSSPKHSGSQALPAVTSGRATEATLD